MESTALRERVAGLNLEVQRTRAVLAGETGDLSVSVAVGPRVVHLLERAVDVLAKTEQHYESNGVDQSTVRHVEEPGVLTDIGALISSAIAAQEIGDLAFLASYQLSECRAKLEAAIRAEDAMRTASQSDVGLRRLRRALSAMERAICNFEGWEAPPEERAELQEALDVRRFYWELRRIIFGPGEPTNAELRPRLRNFISVIEAMRSREVFTLVRVEDRVQMFQLHDRIEAWLDRDDSSRIVGRCLWKDMTAFANLLTEINKRQELRRHDLELIGDARRELGELADDEPVSSELAEDMKSALGLDDELDNLILHVSKTTPGQWLTTCDRLYRHLANEGDDLDREVFLQPAEAEGSE
jgi:hypothetical protein